MAWKGPEASPGPGRVAGRACPDPATEASPGRQDRGRGSGYSPGAKPAWCELSVAGLGQLARSAESEEPGKPLGHAPHPGWAVQRGTQTQRDRDILSHREPGTRSEPPPDLCSWPNSTLTLETLLLAPPPNPSFCCFSLFPSRAASTCK